MNIEFEFWNVRTLYRASSLMTVSRQLSRYKLDLAGVQEGCVTEPEGDTHFLWKGE
jgi:hypothetical protein